MLENAYIEKYKKENYELYNIENTLEDVLSNKRKLLICEEIANYVVVFQFLKNKYVYDYTNKRFNYCQRDTIENLILSNSSLDILAISIIFKSVIFSFNKFLTIRV